MNLKSGDYIDIIAPSSFPKNNQWKKGVKILQGWGLKPHLEKNFISPWLFHSHNNKKRSFFLNQSFSNSKSSAVWMLRGGYGLQKLMPSFIKSYPKKSKKKLFIGYSDGTALHLYLNSKNYPTLQASSLCELPDLSKRDLSLLKNILFGIKKEIVFKSLNCFSTKPLKKKTQKIRAPIMGGNLTLLSSCIGTTWFPQFQSHFLFIEDVNEEVYKVDRLLHHLFYSGSLKGVKALLLGSFSPLSKEVLKNKVLKSFSDVCNIPIIFGLPCGHNRSHQALPFKVPSELRIDKDQAELKILLK